MSPTIRCVGCGGLVPDVDGPVHLYMHSSPGCWRIFGEMLPARDLRVDAYAVQHPGNAINDARQRRSIAVHLMTLCLALEDRLPVDRIRSSISERALPRLGLDDWPHLVAPRSMGEVTVAEVVATDVLVARWARSAWDAWAEHHGTVRTWASAVLQ